MNEIIAIGPVSPLRQRLIEDMTIRRFGPDTQRNYQRDVGRFATWLGRSPHTATAEDVRRFQIEQGEAGVPAPTMNSIVAALRFLFNHTLDRPDLARMIHASRARSQDPGGVDPERGEAAARCDHQPQALGRDDCAT